MYFVLYVTFVVLYQKIFFGFEKDFENKYLHFIFRFYFLFQKRFGLFAFFTTGSD